MVRTSLRRHLKNFAYTRKYVALERKKNQREAVIVRSILWVESNEESATSGRAIVMMLTKVELHLELAGTRLTIKWVSQHLWRC
jgi:hypothetical protein